MQIAITRLVPATVEGCELTHLERHPIDLELARRQHRDYEAVLQTLGCTIHSLPALDEFPDSVFVEDCAVVLETIAVITRPGAESRREETVTVTEALRKWRRVEHIVAPATLDGGDILRIGETIYAGISGRTNAHGVEQLRRIASSHGYVVQALEVRGCLHLKSAVTALPGGAVLVNQQWIDASQLMASSIIDIDPAEPYAANVLTIGDEVVCAAAFPRTRDRLERSGYRTRAVDLSELAKAEGALTCCSIIL